MERGIINALYSHLVSSVNDPIASRLNRTYISIGICPRLLPGGFQIIDEFLPLRVLGRYPILEYLPVYDVSSATFYFLDLGSEAIFVALLE